MGFGVQGLSFHLDCQNVLDLEQLQQQSAAKLGKFNSLVVKLNSWKQGEHCMLGGAFLGTVREEGT